MRSPEKGKCEKTGKYELPLYLTLLVMLHFHSFFCFQITKVEDRKLSKMFQKVVESFADEVVKQKYE